MNKNPEHVMTSDVDSYVMIGLITVLLTRRPQHSRTAETSRLAEEEPENPDYPKDPAFKEKFGPRGVLRSWVTPHGGQKVEDTGPLTKKRMETIDYEITDAALSFTEKAAQDKTPFFMWWNSTRVHVWTHLRPEAGGP